MRQVKAKYVVGLTATPERKDGHHPIIYMQCGPIRLKLSARSHNYHAAPGNLTSLSLFRARISRVWRGLLRQRSDQRKLDWKRFNHVCIRYLPPPRTLHPYLYQRFNVTHPRWEPYA